jgi:hypothetical protein
MFGGEGGAASGAPMNLKITIPKWCGKWVVTMDEFKDGVVGAKSKNIANLRGKIPDWIRLPAAVTVPFGSFEAVGGEGGEGGVGWVWLEGLQDVVLGEWGAGKVQQRTHTAHTCGCCWAAKVVCPVIRSWVGEACPVSQRVSSHLGCSVACLLSEHPRQEDRHCNTG